MDETLKKVSLAGLRGPPCDLQLLVRLEEAAAADQRKTLPERSLLLHRGTVTTDLSRPLRRRYALRVATILLCGVDLFFRGKLEALLPEHRLITVDHTEEPDLVIADISRVDPVEVADTYLDVPILGYTNHTDTTGLRAAHAAGFDQVVAKSALVERAADLVRDLAPAGDG